MLHLYRARHHLSKAVLLVDSPSHALYFQELQGHLESTARHLLLLLPREKRPLNWQRPWEKWSLVYLHFRFEQVRRWVTEAHLLLKQKAQQEQIWAAYQLLMQVHFTATLS